MKMHFSRVFLVITAVAVCNLPLVRQQYHSGKFLGKYSIPNNTSSPTDINSEEVYKVKLFPFILHATLSDKVKVVNTGKLVEVILDQKFTTSAVTGGVLGKNIYIFKKIKYIWTDNENGTVGTTIDGKGFPLDNVAIFHNVKYGTFENALNYRDGLAEVYFYIDICSTPNKLFAEKYSSQLREIQKAGSKVETTLGTAIKWFAGNGVIPPTDAYYAYPGSYLDEKGQMYESTTLIILPHLPQWCLSDKQFKETFGSFKDFAGQSLTNTEPRFPRTMPVVQANGILNFNTP